jgi:putative restriction endonuclease
LTEWVASLSAAEADNWEICRRESWFGTGTSRGARVRAGDELFMWRAKEGLFAYCIVTGDAEPVTEDSHVPWPNRSKYKYVWPIEVVIDRSEPLRIKWKELDSLAGIGGVPASQLPPIEEGRTGAVRDLFHSAGSERLVGIDAADTVRQDLQKINDEHDARVAVVAAILRRQGQGRFRQELLDAYGRRCCVTGCDVEPALEAAHISPYRGEHTNRVGNGLLLRADIHTLFDLYLLTVLPSGAVQVHPDLRASVYAEFHGHPIRPPRSARESPEAEVLERHHRRCEWLNGR